MESYTRLTALDPGNQEAWFDLAQAACGLGLGDQEAWAYDQLLARDPLHNLAGLAQARLEQRGHPRLGAEYSLWQEQGYGERSQMTRHQAALQLEAPLARRFQLQAAGLSWQERPTRWAGAARAQGFRLGGEGVLTPRLQASGQWTHKRFEDDALGSRDLGAGQVWFRAWDYLRIGLGWSREEVLANAFALDQATQADTWWLGLSSRISKRLEASLRLRRLDYNDGNQGVWHGLEASYLLALAPRQLKLWLDVDYRDHEQDTREIYAQGRLSDMVHPYWAPQNWWGGVLGLLWRHDLAPPRYGGAPRHFYELGLAVTDDNEANPGWQAQAAWHCELAQGWDAQLKGALYRSRQWDAGGVWLSLGYRF